MLIIPSTRKPLHEADWFWLIYVCVVEPVFLFKLKYFLTQKIRFKMKKIIIQRQLKITIYKFLSATKSKAELARRRELPLTVTVTSGNSTIN